MRVPPVIWAASGFEQTSITRLALANDASIHLLPADREAGARGCRGALAQADGPRGPDPPARRRAVVVPARGLAGARERRADHPRGDERDRRAGAADAGAAPGRAVAALRALRHPGA